MKMKKLFFIILAIVVGAFCASSPVLAGETIDPGSVDCCPIEFAPGKIWAQFTKNGRAISCPMPPIDNWVRGGKWTRFFSIPPTATDVRLWVGTGLVVSFPLSVTQGDYKFGGGGYSEIIIKTIGDTLIVELSRE